MEALADSSGILQGGFVSERKWRISFQSIKEQSVDEFA